jgi:S-adenosylmethionine-diacylglycerol 3-amino-3-carboxypropyl transferase
MTHLPTSEPSLDWWRAGRIDAGPIDRARPRVLFGQVYEDPAVELAALAAVPAPRRAMCIGSGGETALSLLTGAPERVSAVDINPAQITLVRLKVAAVRRLSREQAIRCFDLDARPWYPILREDLEPELRSFWDARQATLARGLSHCGFVDRRLRRAMGVFRLLVHREHTIRNLLTLGDVPAQAAYYRARWRSITWRLLFALAFARPVLSRLYRRGVLRSLPSDFGALIERRFERALLSGPARDNGYLWQVLLGRFPPGSEDGLPPCLRADLYPVVQHETARARWSSGAGSSRHPIQPPTR